VAERGLLFSLITKSIRFPLFGEYNPREELLEQTRLDLEHNGGHLTDNERRFIMLGAHIENHRNIPQHHIAQA
jgi:hypothetical protein